MAAAIYIGAGVYPAVKCVLTMFAMWAPANYLPVSWVNRQFYRKGLHRFYPGGNVRAGLSPPLG